jgi:predicted ATPase
MEQSAPPGAVWMTDATVKLGQGRLRATLIGPMLIKGVPEPIDVYELTGISVRTRFQANALRGLSELVGREETLAQLERALAAAHSGSKQTAVLAGDPGVGKSRLCYELLLRAGPSVRVLEASSFSYMSARPLGLLASILRALFAIDDGDMPEQIASKAKRLLSDQPSLVLSAALELLDVPVRDREWEQLEPQQKRARITELLRGLLSRFCAREPSVLLCEDLHWCDPESLEFISQLCEEPPGSRLLLLLTHRPELVPPWHGRPHVVSCEVRALGTEASERLLASLLGPGESLAALRAWLAQRTDGNPFFIEESARAVLETGMVDQRERLERADVPASIEALLNARVDRLHESALELLQAAAVLDEQAPSEVLRAVLRLEPPEFDARLELLARADLLYEALVLVSEDPSAAPAATLRFKHALVQEVVYKRLVRPRRRALHARVIEVIEGQHRSRIAEQVERLAEHAYRAELWPQCAEYQRLACVRAASRGATALATAHLDRGLEALQHLPDSPMRSRLAIDLRLTALAALLPAGAIERAITLLQEAAREAEALHDVARLARVSSQLSAQLWCVARYEEARQRAEQSLALSAELDGDQFALEASANYNLAMVQHACASFADARMRLDRLQVQLSGAAERRRLGWAGYPSVLVRTFIISNASMTGDFEDAERAYEQGRAIADALGHAFSRTMLMQQYGMCLLVRGETERAVQVLSECLALCRSEAVVAMTPASKTHLGLALLELGEREHARALIDSIDDAELVRAGHYATIYKLLAQSELGRCLGELEHARTFAERAVEETARYGEHGFHVLSLVQLADVLCEGGSERQQALPIYEQALKRARELGMRPCCALALQGIATVHAQRGELEQAALAVERAREIWGLLSAPARLRQMAELRRGARLR